VVEPLLSEGDSLRLRLGEAAYSLGGEKLILGRSRSCDIRVKVDTISRLHAVFMWHEGELVLEDLGSTNGTFVNGHRLQEPGTVYAGDTLQFGSLHGAIEGPAGSPLRPSVPSDAPHDYTFGLLPGTPAGLGWRLLALWLDIVLFAAGSLIPFAPYLVMVFAERYLLAPGVLPPSHQMRAIVGGGCAGLWILYAWYYVVHGWAARGGTPGMRICGLRLLDWQFRVPIGYPRALARLLAVLLTGLTAGLGLLMVAVRADRRALHDMIARTIVAHRPPGGPPSRAV
jgi:uncharacterized RDD family membrane protein YckC